MLRLQEEIKRNALEGGSKGTDFGPFRADSEYAEERLSVTASCDTQNTAEEMLYHLQQPLWSVPLPIMDKRTTELPEFCSR